MKSKLQTTKECYLCREWGGYSNSRFLEEHHIFEGTANRRKSEQWGMKVWLCSDHHRNGADAVHRNKEVALWLKIKAQKKFEEEHTRVEFRQEFGKSYILGGE